MRNILVVADDFTGACEIGALFARSNAPVHVWLPGHTREPAGPLSVLNMDSRHLSGEDARQHMAALMQGQADVVSSLLLKKIDSTLRGPIGEEVEMLRKVAGAASVILAPALPSQGRTTIAGHQLLRGVPLEYTSVSRDPVNPVTISHIPTLLLSQAGIRACTIGLQAVDEGAEALTLALKRSLETFSYCVLDAATEEHLKTIAKATHRLWGESILVGTSGLARHLADILLPERAAFLPTPARGLDLSGILVVCGSMNPTNAEQLRLLREAAPETPLLTTGQATARGPDALAHHMNSTGLILVTPRERHGQDQALVMARCVQQIIGKAKPSGILATGGETAQRTLEALAAKSVIVCGEAASGLPAGQIHGGMASGVPIITKAGGFGEVTTLRDVVRHLQRPDAGTSRHS